MVPDFDDLEWVVSFGEPLEGGGESFTGFVFTNMVASPPPSRSLPAAKPALTKFAVL